MQVNTNEYLCHLEKVCEEYCMNALDVYNVLISKNDDDFPLSFEIVKAKVLKDINCDILKQIFTLEELKSIFSDTSIKQIKKIKNVQTRKFVQTFN